MPRSDKIKEAGLLIVNDRVWIASIYDGDTKLDSLVALMEIDGTALKLAVNTVFPVGDGTTITKARISDAIDPNFYMEKDFSNAEFFEDGGLFTLTKFDLEL